MDTQFLFSVLSFSSLLFFFFLFIIFRSFKSNNSNLPPQPWKLPLIGHIHHLIHAPPHHSLRTIALKLGPIFHLQLGQVSAIVISSPSLAKQILKTHDLSFATRPNLLSVEIIGYNYAGIAFAPYGDYWRQMRKIAVMELLSAKKVQSFRSIREQESWELVESIASTDQAINLSDMIFSLINSIMGREIVGSRCKDQDLLLKVMRRVMDVSGGFDVCDVFPEVKFLRLITGARRKMVKIRKQLDLIFDEIILEHQQRRVNVNGKIKHDEEEEDLLDVLLKLKDDDGGFEFPIHFDNIKAFMLDTFGGGSDTSAVTIEWVMSELIKNPSVMKKAQEELRQTLKGRTKIHESDIQQLNYLKLVIKETLRLHPPVPFLLPRECRENCEIGGFHVPVKTKVIMNIWMIGRDPDYWIEPERFLPERFSDMTGTDFEYLPFGAGRRMCPGMMLGLANVELPLAMLLYHFDWELPNGQTAEDFDMSESFGVVLKRKNDLLLIPHPYNENC